MKPDVLLELLNKDRDYHTTHPQSAFTTFLYALGASLASVVAAIYFSGNSTATEIQAFFSKVPGFVFLFFLLGLGFILAGLAEHNLLHKQQRIRIEDAMEYILTNSEKFDYAYFWDRFKKQKLKFPGGSLKVATPLFTVEPDTRKFWYFHDRKIEIGVLLIIIAYAILIYIAVV